MTIHSKLFQNAMGFLGFWALFSSSPAYALLIAHSEVHVSNVQITSTGSLAWSYDPWLNIAAAGAFDDPSGWSQAYDDDPGATGQAVALATTAYASAQSAASSNLLTIDASGDLNNTTNDVFALNAYGYGELYNTFLVSGNDPVQATFSLDWSALLSGQSSSGQSFYADYAVQLLLSDGITDWSQEAFNTLSGTGALQSISEGGTLGLTLTLQPNILYSLDIIAHPDDRNHIPEPPQIVLLVGAGLLAQMVGFFRRKKRCLNTVTIYQN